MRKHWKHRKSGKRVHRPGSSIASTGFPTSLCVGFLFFLFCIPSAVRLPSGVRSSSFFRTHTQLFHTHTQVFTHTQHCYTQNSFTYDSCTKPVLHHLLCLARLSHSTLGLTLDEVDMWGYPVLYFSVFPSSCFSPCGDWCLKAREDCEGNGASN